MQLWFHAGVPEGGGAQKKGVGQARVLSLPSTGSLLQLLKISKNCDSNEITNENSMPSAARASPRTIANIEPQTPRQGVVPPLADFPNKNPHHHCETLMTSIPSAAVVSSSGRRYLWTTLERRFDCQSTYPRQRRRPASPAPPTSLAYLAPPSAPAPPAHVYWWARRFAAHVYARALRCRARAAATYQRPRALSQLDDRPPPIITCLFMVLHSCLFNNHFYNNNAAAFLCNCDILQL